VKFDTEESFISYLSAFGTENTRLFLDKDNLTFTAIIDYHAAGAEPKQGVNRKEHIARFVMNHTSDWEAWIGIDGCTIAQRDFAEFIEDHTRNIVEPDAATMLTIAKSLQVKRNVSFVSEQRLGDGTVNFVYQEDDDAKAGSKGTIVLPEEVTLGIVVFEDDSDADTIQAKFRYRLDRDSGKLGFMVKLMNKEGVIDQAFGSIVDSIEESGYHVLRGVATL
jgi:uncharacterized protein YfdQ (DUF2303 family)